LRGHGGRARRPFRRRSVVGGDAPGDAPRLGRRGGGGDVLFAVRAPGVAAPAPEGGRVGSPGAPRVAAAPQGVEPVDVDVDPGPEGPLVDRAGGGLGGRGGLASVRGRVRLGRPGVGRHGLLGDVSAARGKKTKTR